MIKKSVLLMVSLLAVLVIAVVLAKPLNPNQASVVVVLGIMAAVLSICCFILSEWTGNYSQVDRIWSLAPLAYAWTACYLSGFPIRMSLVAILITIWGLRLTYNFSRLGAYRWPFWKAHEDYRWKVLQARKEFQNPWVWRWFNLFFISLYQNGLILYFTLPIVLLDDHGPLLWCDYLLAIVLLGVILLETIADNQQWRFQQKKKKASGDWSGKGFIDSGLWAYSRHPNYLAEQMFWVGVYAFSVIGTGSWLNWSIGGCILLILLFQGSSDFSESISTSKYPEYTDYKTSTGRFFPKFW